MSRLGPQIVWLSHPRQPRKSKCFRVGKRCPRRLSRGRGVGLAVWFVWESFLEIFRFTDGVLNGRTWIPGQKKRQAGGALREALPLFVFSARLSAPRRRGCAGKYCRFFRRQTEHARSRLFGSSRYPESGCRIRPRRAARKNGTSASHPVAGTHRAPRRNFFPLRRAHRAPARRD